MVENNIFRRFGIIITNLFGNKIAYYCKYPFDRKTIIKELKRGKIKIPNNPRQKISRIAIIFIGTNRYIDFFPKYYLTIKKYFLLNTEKDFFVFTDQIDYEFLKNKKDVIVVPSQHQGWPFSTLLRFKLINKIANKLKNYSHIIYIDADMYANEIVSENEFFSHNKPLFGVQHDSYTNKQGEFEKSPLSLAAVNNGEDLSIYNVGAFWGGQKDYFLNLIAELEKRVDIDLKNNIIAKWHDESHLNKYFIENRHLVYTLDPSYAFPELKPIPRPFKKKFVHVLQNPIKKNTLNRNFSN